MLKEMSFQQKFQLLEPWFQRIIESVKKEIRQEHLDKDRAFTKAYFGNKPTLRINVHELCTVYGKVIMEGNEKVAEFIALRWLLKHAELYQQFEKILAEISPDFDQLDALSEETGKKLLLSAIPEFGAIVTYLFSIFNSVLFPEIQLQKLRELAVKELQEDQKNRELATEMVTIEELKKNHQLALQRIMDKYEKKLSGLQKKYLQDTENLKKQISGLQRNR